VVLPALAAGQLGSVARASLVLTLPLVVSAAIVNILFAPGEGDALLDLGPVKVTAQGIGLSVAVALRVLVIAGAGLLLLWTTRTAELVADLERRGLPPRATFLVASAVSAIPSLVERARSVSAAQRARGLDTEGSAWQRVRGLWPLVGPTVVGTIARAEARAMALEARAFSRPGRRALLWAPDDDRLQRAARWGMAAGVGALVVIRLAGLDLPC
jgi:energy-coupling factor transport system permease protein